MLSILEPLKPYYSEEKARLTLGVTMAHYDIGATWMEAFSPSLMGTGAFLGRRRKEPEFEEIYRKGLTAGTDEKNPEYWGECTSFDQRFVEMAAISLRHHVRTSGGMGSSHRRAESESLPTT